MGGYSGGLGFEKIALANIGVTEREVEEDWERVKEACDHELRWLPIVF